MNSIIKIKNLNKSFSEVRAVQNLSFKVKKGELFSFLGINGAGKSTTISIICGQLSKDSGSVFVCGENIDTNMQKISSKLGVVFQNSVLDSSLTVKDNLQSRAALYGITGHDFKKRLKELCLLLDLEKLLNRTVGKLSGGQRRRIDVARALIHKPEILILDEPTTGLDPQTRKLLWEVISNLRKEENLTVFLTTHYMEEAVDSDYIVILDSGKIVAEGTPLELKNKYTDDHIILYGLDETQINSLNLPYKTLRDGIRISIPNTKTATDIIMKNPDIFVDYEITKGKIDDVFINATGKNLVQGDDK